MLFSREKGAGWDASCRLRPAPCLRLARLAAPSDIDGIDGGQIGAEITEQAESDKPDGDGRSEARPEKRPTGVDPFFAEYWSKT